MIRTDEGRWFCRQCEPKGGDVEGFLMTFRGLSYPDACRVTGRDTSRYTWRYQRPNQITQDRRSEFTPALPMDPPEIWKQRAGLVAQAAQIDLWQTPDQVRYLRGRGLTSESIKAAGLGWIPKTRFESRETWGLPPELNDRGRPKKVWMPEGLVIPCYGPGGEVIRLRVRRPEGEPRYVLVPGSDTRPMVMGAIGLFEAVVESELDALLMAQETPLVTAIALGSAQKRPDAETDRILRTARVILNVLDYDEAGGRSVWQWWAEVYPHMTRWLVPEGKDPGEYHQAGGDLRFWVETGLSHALGIDGPPDDIWYEFEERAAIYQFQGGLSRVEAETAALDFVSR